MANRAKQIAETELEDRDRTEVGEGALKHRWRGCGGMAKYFQCLVRYSLLAPRWREGFDHGARKALAELPKVTSGQETLPDLITKIARHDLRLRIRLAKYLFFQLSLTIDAKWKDLANKAHRQLLQRSGPPLNVAGNKVGDQSNADAENECAISRPVPPPPRPTHPPSAPATDSSS